MRFCAKGGLELVRHLHAQQIGGGAVVSGDSAFFGVRAVVDPGVEEHMRIAHVDCRAFVYTVLRPERDDTVVIVGQRRRASRTAGYGGLVVGLLSAKLPAPVELVIGAPSPSSAARRFGK